MCVFSEENSEENHYFTVFFTRGENSEENTQFQLSLNKVPFSTCKKFPHEIIFPCLKCFLFVIHLHLSWTLASPRKLGQQRSTWGANGSLRKNISRLGKMISFWKHFYRWEKRHRINPKAMLHLWRHTNLISTSMSMIWDFLNILISLRTLCNA